MSIKLNGNEPKIEIGNTNINRIYVGSTLIKGSTPIIPTGQDEYILPGTYSWTAPLGVTSVSVVAIGGSENGSGNNGSSGGGLGWRNNISVIPGNSYTVQVGNYGGDSYFINTSTVKGGTGSPALGGDYVGDGGGNGGRGYYGGGGAGGYSGNGGNGGYLVGSGTGTPNGQNGTGGAGGGGGGLSALNTGYNSGGGGGTGIYGEGASGIGGAQGNFSTGYPGTGGSSGANGVGTNGGLYGGGGAVTLNTGHGTNGTGAVRIIYGTDRAFPSTNTQDL